MYIIKQMVSVSGINLMNGGMCRINRGRGIGRKIAGSVLGTLGNALVNRIARAVSGGRYRRKTTYRRRRVTAGSYKITGMGKRRKTYRKRRLIGTGRRTIRRTTYRKRRTTGGRVGRPKTRRIGTVRRRRILII